MPRAGLDAVNRMTNAAEKAVFIAAHALASRARRDSVYVDKVSWLILSGLGKNSFNRGLKLCKSKGLLTYSRGTLTINDPLTGKPNMRWMYKKEFIVHDNPQWDFDLTKDVSAEEWHFVVESLLGRKLETDSSGWTLRTACPFCGDLKAKFHANFKLSAFKCHGCKASGRLGQLVTRVQNVSMTAAKEFIRERQAELQGMRVEV